MPWKQGWDGKKNFPLFAFHETSGRRSAWGSKDLSKADLPLINNSTQLLKFLLPTFLIFVVAT